MNETYVSPYSYKHTIVNGKMMPPFFTQHHYDTALQNHPWKDGDIVISTYPKSGTTLMLNLVYNMVHGDLPDNTSLSKVCPWHEVLSSKPLSSVVPQNRRVWKSHLDWNDIYKTEHDIKYIYVARNPMDVAVSMYHHTRAFLSFEYTGDWNDSFERFISNQVMYNGWHDHVLGWWNAYKKQEKDILFVFFEDFKLNPKEFIKNIANYLNVELTDEKLRKILDVTSFESMKNNPQTNFTSNRRKEEPEFIRKGAIGDWREYFTNSQIYRFNKYYYKEIRSKSDIQFIFESPFNSIKSRL